MKGFSATAGDPYLENGNPIALLKDGQSVTLEPGGQLELSGAPLHNLHRTCDEVHAHLDQVRTISEELGIGFYGVGFPPRRTARGDPLDAQGSLRDHAPLHADAGQPRPRT